MKNLARAVHRGVLTIDLVVTLAIVVILIIYIFSNSGSLFSKNNTTMELGNVQDIITQTAPC
ncbi:hypothetical protein [Candidatus Regiella endosymbiont of Tuberolachnus salignus]|uniref:hypothetical protein n=1 Tax=Candidatus Regiella endosymbiont of Tuberolachnus salignus TaxID=3077956 RepID=UPI0030CF5290